MNDRNDLFPRVVDMFQRADAREVRFVYVLLRAMLGEEERHED